MVRKTKVGFLAAAVAIVSVLGEGAGVAAERPNLVIVLADDLGYGDLACFGDKVVKTPNLDRLATEGIRLTNCYAAAGNCSPSRTGLMTGRTPCRPGVHNWIAEGSPMHLRRNEITVATLLRQAGYATCHVGKWHLNGRFNEADQPQPSDHGFDWWFSTQNNALPSHRDPDNFVRNGKPVGKLKGHSAQIVVDEAIDWLKSKRDRQKPFFLYVCFHEPHEPIATDPRFASMYKFPNEPSRSAHHGNITQMDDAFGRLMRSLDELSLRDSTFVYFTSDNGPAITAQHPHGSTGPLRAKKGHLYEGGIRVPGILRWPGKAKAGVVCDEPVSGVDLLPTIAAITGVKVPGDRAIDGASMMPILDEKPIERQTPLFWVFPVASSKPKAALRVGDWKVLAHVTGPDFTPTGDIEAEFQQTIKTARLAAFELYNLRTDVGETTDLAAKERKRLGQMATQLQSLYQSVQQETPVWPAWRWPREESKRIEWPSYWVKKAKAKKKQGQ